MKIWYSFLCYINVFFFFFSSFLICISIHNTHNNKNVNSWYHSRGKEKRRKGEMFSVWQINSYRKQKERGKKVPAGCEDWCCARIDRIDLWLGVRLRSTNCNPLREISIWDTVTGTFFFLKSMLSIAYKYCTTIHQVKAKKKLIFSS